MIDFDISFRPWRTLYITILALAVYLISDNIWVGLITLLAIFDIKIDLNIFKRENALPTEEHNDDNITYGPES